MRSGYATVDIIEEHILLGILKPDALECRAVSNCVFVANHTETAYMGLMMRSYNCCSIHCKCGIEL